MKDIDKIFEDWDELEYEFDIIPLPHYEIKDHYKEFIGRKVVLNPNSALFKELKLNPDKNYYGKIYEIINHNFFIEVEWEDKEPLTRLLPRELMLVNE